MGNLMSQLAEDYFVLGAMALVLFLSIWLIIYRIRYSIANRAEERRRKERSSLLRIDSFLDQCKEEGVIGDREEVHRRAHFIRDSFSEDLQFEEDENSKPFSEKLETNRRIYIKVIPFREGNSFLFTSA